MQIYSDTDRYVNEDGERAYPRYKTHVFRIYAGFYCCYCLPGCLPDSLPIGPYDTEEAAIEALREE